MYGRDRRGVGGLDTIDPVAVVIANASTGYVRNSPAYPDDATATSRWGEAVEGR